MSLFRASMHSLVQTATRLGLGLINVKVAAVYLGPVGVGLYGQFWSLFGVLSGPLVAPIATVLTREIASHDDRERQQILTCQAIRLSFLIGLTLITLSLPFAGHISEWLFQSNEYTLQVIFAAVALLPVFLNTTFIATARGTRQLKKLTISELLIALSGTLCTIVAIPLWGIHGAFFSLTMSATLGSILLLIQYRNSGWLAQLFSFRDAPDFRRNFLHFFATSIVTATTIAIVPIFIRNEIANQLGPDNVGYWQAGIRLSDLYFSIFSALFAMHFLPRFAEISSRNEMRTDLWHSAIRIIPIAAFGALLIYLLLDLLVPMLYTYEFLPLKQIMGWQLAGVVIQTCAWHIRFVVVAKGHTWWVASTDIVFSALWLVMTVALLPLFGLTAVSMAYCLRYTLDMLFSILKCRQVISELPNQ